MGMLLQSLVICVGNPPVTGGFPPRGQVMEIFILFVSTLSIQIYPNELFFVAKTMVMTTYNDSVITKLHSQSNIVHVQKVVLLTYFYGKSSVLMAKSFTEYKLVQQ